MYFPKSQQQKIFKKLVKTLRFVLLCFNSEVYLTMSMVLPSKL